MLFAGKLVVAHKWIFIFRQIYIHIGDSVEEAHQFKIPVVAYHPHLGYARFFGRYGRLVGLADGTDSGVASRDAAIYVKPFAVEKSIVGLYLGGLHIVNFPKVSLTASSLVGIVSTHFAIAPVGQRIEMRIVGIGVAAAKGRICTVDKYVYRLGIIDVTFRERPLRFVFEKFIAARNECDRGSEESEYIFEFHVILDLKMSVLETKLQTEGVLSGHCIGITETLRVSSTILGDGKEILSLEIYTRTLER